MDSDPSNVAPSIHAPDGAAERAMDAFRWPAAAGRQCEFQGDRQARKDKVNLGGEVDGTLGAPRLLELTWSIGLLSTAMKTCMSAASQVGHTGPKLRRALDRNLPPAQEKVPATKIAPIGLQQPV